MMSITTDKNTEYPAIDRRLRVRKKSWSGSRIYDWSTYTWNDGSYYAYVYPTKNGAGYYKFEPQAKDFPTGATFTPPNYEDNNVTQRGYLSGKHFAVQVPSGSEDVSTRIMSWWDWNSRPGFTTYFYIKYQNDGTKPKSDVVSFEYDKLLTFEDWHENNWWHWWGDKPTPNKAQLLADANNTLSWTYSNLNPGESRYIVVKARIQRPTVERNLLGETMYCTSEITFSGTDIDISNNKYVESRVITGSYDPNDKRVLPAGDVPPEFVDNEEYLTYRVRFQNSGTDTAFNVRVEDQLSEKLDWESLKMLGADHNYRLDIDSTGKAVWYFDNILLPDDKVDEPGSHGQFEYQIKIKNDGSVKFGDKFGTKAYIYFDYNPPIITNQSDTRVWADLVAPKTTSLTLANGEINVASSTKLTLDFDEAIKRDKGKLYIFQSDGRLLQHIDIQSDKVILSNTTLQIEPDNLTPKNGRVEEPFDVYVLMDYGSVIDLATNQHLGIQDKNTWRFTVGQIQTPTENTNQNGNSDFAPPAPDAPSNLQVDDISANSAKLTWEASEIITDRYQIYRRTEGVDFELIGTVDDIAFTDENITPNTLYEYKIVSVNQGGETESVIISIRTLPTTPVMNTPEMAVCVGNVVQLTASGTSETDTLNWYYENEDTIFATGSTISTTKAGTYFVALFQHGQEGKRVKAKVAIHDFPTANIQDGKRTFCGGGVLQAYRISGASYFWKNANGEEVSKNPRFSVSTSGTYTLTVERNGCAATSDATTVTITPSDLKAEILEGNQVQFCQPSELSAQAQDNVTYHWAKDGEELTTTGSKLVVSESGIYSLQVSNSECFSNTVRIAVEMITPQTPQIRAERTEIYETQRATLRTDYQRNASLQWYKDGEKIEGATRNQWTTREAGIYVVKAIYKAGCETTSETTTIRIKDNPTISFVDGTLNITDIEDPTEIFTIQWFVDGKPVSVQDGQPTEAGIYTVIITLRDGTKLYPDGVQIQAGVLSIEAENKYGVEIYPNPVADIFTVSVNNTYLGKVQISITDMAGRTIYQKKMEKTAQNMRFRSQIKEWAKGAYHIKMVFGDTQVVQTIIKE